MKIRGIADRFKHDAVTVYLIARDPRTSLPVRLIALAIAAYAFSPVDLIPDFIPVLGLIDDLIVLPIGISLILKLTSADIVEDNRRRALDIATHPVSNVAAVVIVSIWIFAAALLGYWFFDSLRPETPVPTEIVDR